MNVTPLYFDLNLSRKCRPVYGVRFNSPRVSIFSLELKRRKPRRKRERKGTRKDGRTDGRTEEKDKETKKKERGEGVRRGGERDGKELVFTLVGVW